MGGLLGDQLDFWDDTRIEPGQIWRKEIENALKAAKVAVLLVSPTFLASDFICRSELPPLLAAAKAEGVTILPLIVRFSTFDEIQILSQFQAVNPPNRPLNKMEQHEQDQVLVTVAKRIRAVLRTNTSKSTKMKKSH